MSIINFQHRSVLLEQTVTHLPSCEDGIYLDCTLGGGGHSLELLKKKGSRSIVIGIDRDPQAIQAASEKLKTYNNRFVPIHGQFSQLEELIQELESAQRLEIDHISFTGIVMDLGVSSPQIDQAKRGFSFQKDGPVDMRMNPNQELTAAEWLKQQTEKSLADQLFHYGEEPRSRQIARAIIKGNPWDSTLKLAECIRASSGYKNSRSDPAARSFQAIRIAVNEELEELKKGISSAINRLKSGGRLAVISFHSIEDRYVKRTFRTAAGIGTPKDAYGHPLVPAIGRLVKPKGLSGKEHDPENPRARSARLRILEKL